MTGLRGAAIGPLYGAALVECDVIPHVEEWRLSARRNLISGLGAGRAAMPKARRMQVRRSSLGWVRRCGPLLLQAAACDFEELGAFVVVEVAQVGESG